jgi:hypothetical protein
MSFSTERERWFAFRSERLRVFMEAWLGAHGLHPVPRPASETTPEEEVVESKTESDETAAPTNESAHNRRNKGTEILRKQLSELAEAMMGRDLEKVVAFAEFLKARRAARTYSQRSDSTPPQAPTPEPEELEEVPAIPPTRH